MLYAAVVFLLITLAAGILGLSAGAGTAAAVAKLLFTVCFVIFFVMLQRRRRIGIRSSPSLRPPPIL